MQSNLTFIDNLRILFESAFNIKNRITTHKSFFILITILMTVLVFEKDVIYLFMSSDSYSFIGSMLNALMIPLSVIIPFLLVASVVSFNNLYSLKQKKDMFKKVWNFKLYFIYTFLLSLVIVCISYYFLMLLNALVPFNLISYTDNGILMLDEYYKALLSTSSVYVPYIANAALYFTIATVATIYVGSVMIFDIEYKNGFFRSLKLVSKLMVNKIITVIFNTLLFLGLFVVYALINSMVPADFYINKICSVLFAVILYVFFGNYILTVSSFLNSEDKNK